MSRTWTFKTIDNGDVVAEQHGLSHDQAVEAIYAAMGRPVFNPAERGEVTELSATAERELAAVA